MAGLNFDITADNTNIKAKLEETQRKISQMADYAEKEGENLDKVFSNIGKSIAAIGLGFSAQELGRQIVQVRGEFQQLEVAFKTILGSEEKATELMSQMVQTAATTPFDLQSVASGAKQLLAYGTSVDEVNDKLVMLGDIAAGLSIPLSELIYLYGTTMTQGRLYTQDFNQFVGRGIPLLSELAKQFGVAESEIRGMVEAGRVGFPEVEKVLQNLTSEGGMFYNLMAEQSKTISGQISNIGDSFSMMLNDIGKANEGVINDALGGVSYLLENYEKIGKTIVELVAAYGAYKAVLISITAFQKAYLVVMQQAALEQSLAAASGVALTASQSALAASTKLVNVSMKALNATLLANPYALAAAAVVALGYGLYKLATYQTEYEKGLERLKDSVSEFNTEVISEQRELARLKGELEGTKKGTSEYNDVKDKIVKGFSKYYKGLEDEIEKVGLTEEAYKKLTAAINQSFGARQYKKFSEEQQGFLDETTAENLEKIQDKMIDKLGVEAGSRYYAKLRDAILQGNLKMGSGYNEILGLDKELQDVLNKVSGKDSKLFYWQDVEKWIKNIITAQEAYEKLDAKAKQRFGIGDTSILPDSSETEAEANKTNDKLSDVIAKIKETEKNIKSLRTQASQGLISTADVDSAIAELDTLKKKYKSMTGEDYGNKKVQQQALKDQEDLNNQLIELQKKNEDEQISLLQDGSERQIAEIKLRYERELQAIEELEEKLKKAQGGTLTSDQQKIIDNAKSVAKQKYDIDISKVTTEELEKEKKALEEYYIQYGDYWEKRKNLVEKYQDAIAKATTKGEKMSLVAELTEALSNMDNEAQKKTSIITKLFTDMSDKSAEEIRNIAKEAENLLEFINSGTYNKNNAFGITKEQFDILSKSPDELDKIKKAIANLYKEADDVDPIFKRIGSTLKDIFNETDTDKLQKSLQSLSGDVNQLMNAVGFLSDSFSKLGEAFGSDTLSGIAEGLNVAMDAVNSAMQGAQAGSMFGPIGASAGAAIGLVTSLASSIAKIHDKKNEKAIQDLQAQIDDLSAGYEILGNAVEKAFSVDASKLIGQQNELLEQQKLLIQQQIAEEKDKKNTDEERIRQWEQQIQNINEQIEENGRKSVEAIAGTSIMSAIDEFAEAYAEAWENGTSAAEASTNVVKKLIQTSLIEFLKNKLAPQIQDFMSLLAAYMYDGVISPVEQSWLDMFVDNMNKIAEDYFNKVGGFFDKKEEESDVNEATDEEISGIKELQYFYDELAKSVEKAYSKDAVEYLNQQNEILKMQIYLIQERINLEKKSEDPDTDYIEDLEDQLKDLNNQLEENKESAINAIFGEDIQSAIENFAASLTNAWAQGSDASISAKDTVKTMMQQMVSESIKAAIQSSGSLEEIRKKLQEFYSDNILSEGEQEYIYNMAEKLQQQIDSQFGWAKDLFKDDSEVSDEDKRLEELKKMYDDLSESVSNAYSQDAVKIILLQNTYLKEQIGLIRTKIEEEEKASNPDTSYLDDLNQQLEDINKQIEENEEAMKDAIFGEDIKSAISNFVNAYTEAIGSGGDMQQASRDFVENMIKNMIIESMKADASPVVENIRNKLFEAWKDGIISSEEQQSIEDLVNNLNKEFEEKYDWADKFFKTEDTQVQGLEELQSQYDRLSDSIDKAYSSEKAELIRQQNALLEQQKELLEDAISKEQAKGGFADSDLIGGWQNELEDIQSQIEENKQSTMDALFGEDIQSQVSSFAESLVDAWASGNDAAKTSGDFVKSVIRNIITESIKMDLTPFLENFREQIKDYMTDGMISAEEGSALKDLVTDITNSLEDQYQWAQGFIQDEQEVVNTVEEVADTFSNITFESMRDDFVSQLSDMTTSYEDMCNNFEDKLKESILRGFLESKYKDQIQNLINTWDIYGESGNIDEGEMEKLREQYKELISAMIKDRDELAEEFGWSKFQQEATSAVGTSASQETGEEISGRLTAVYESGLRRENLLNGILNALMGSTYDLSRVSNYNYSDSLSPVLSEIVNIGVISSQNNVLLSEMRNLMLTGNGYLENISSFSKKIHILLNEKLASIDNNIKNAL